MALLISLLLKSDSLPMYTLSIVREPPVYFAWEKPFLNSHAVQTGCTAKKSVEIKKKHRNEKKELVAKMSPKLKIILYDSMNIHLKF